MRNIFILQTTEPNFGLNDFQRAKKFIKGADGMNAKSLTAKNKLPQEPYRFTKRVGSTTFHIGVYFNPNANETAQDKIIRIIKSEAAFRKAANL